MKTAAAIKLKHFAFGFLFFCLSTIGALAQGAPQVSSPWFQQGKIAAGISVTNSSAATALPTSGLIAWVCNTGAVDAYLAFGTANTVTATVNANSWLKAGTCGSYNLQPFGTTYTFIAAITASSTTTLYVETGTGNPPAQIASASTPPLPLGAATAANQTNVQTAVAPGTAPAVANVSGCVYVAAGVAPTDGQSMAAQCGPNGRALVAVGTSGQFSSDPTVQNASYVSGNCIGGFNAVTVTDYNGQSGFVTNFRISSIGGSTPTITVYLFDANPSASTCTDKSTFTLNSADVDKLIAVPAAATLAAPTGTSVTFSAVDYSPPRPFKAGGSASSGVKTIYYALVSGSTFTPASTTDIHTRVGAALN